MPRGHPDPDLRDIDAMLRDSGVPDWERLAFLASCRDAYAERAKAVLRTCPDCGRVVGEYQAACHCGRVVR